LETICDILRPLETFGRNMDLPSSSELDLIQDPEIGLALLAKCSVAPAQELQRQFWQAQFTHWREWRAVDMLAISRALTHCSILRRPPPRWLCDAIDELCERNMSAAEKRLRRDGIKHFERWMAVELVRGQRPWDPRNYKREVSGDAIWAEAAKLVAGTDAEADVEAIRKSHTLIRHAGGILTTLQDYKRELERSRQRKKRWISKVDSQGSSLPAGRLLGEQFTKR
jgi:hypothetical protein